MDPETLAAYDMDAAAFAKDWLGQPAPVDLQEVVERFFVRGGASADIGCGCGREVAWLDANGFSGHRVRCLGRSAGRGARGDTRRCRFAHAELPELNGIAANAYDNVLCETVIMHLDRKQIAAAVRRLLDIVKPERHSLSELARHRGRRTARCPGPALRGGRCGGGAGRIEGDDGAARRRGGQRLVRQERIPPPRA